MRRSALAVACLAGLAFSPLPAEPPVTSAPNWAPDGRHLLYVSDVAGRQQIWRMSPDGDDQVALSPSEASDSYPIYSPDGRWIAFVSDASGSPQIWRMAADGSARRQLTRSADPAAMPRWSRDGEQIYYSAGGTEQGAQKRIWRMRADGSHAEPIGGPGLSEIYPVPNPVDGRLLSASHPVEGGSFQIHVRTDDAATPVDVSRRDIASYNPDWSPDGEWIAFVSHVGEDRRAAIFITRADGGETRQLTNLPEGTYQPRWSPDGRTIAFRRGWQEHVGLFRIDVDGANLQQLTNRAE